MIIGGLQKTSLLDYPGKISAIIFTQGCNFACVYCHNKELIRTKEHNNVITEQEVIDFLKKRKKQLDALVITGGEPTLQPDLIEFMQKVKKLGYLIKLDSNGSNPDVLEQAIEQKLVDFIAMDLKAPLHKYQTITLREVDTEKINRSIELIKKAGIRHEFRTTVLKSLLSEQDINEIKEMAGDSPFALQKYKPSKDLSMELGRQDNYTDNEFQRFKQDTNCVLR